MPQRTGLGARPTDKASEKSAALYGGLRRKGWAAAQHAQSGFLLPVRSCPGVTVCAGPPPPPTSICMRFLISDAIVMNAFSTFVACERRGAAQHSTCYWGERRQERR